jgi:uncharacterized protein (TIGR00369 family)
MISADEHYRRLERLYRSAPINRIYEPTIHIAEGSAEVASTVRPELFHAAHAVHGSVYFKSLDDAAFFAANSVVTDVFVLTVTYNVVLVRPVSQGVITATGRLVNTSRNLLVAEAELHDDRGKLLARGSGTFMRSTIALDSSVGYM